MKADSPKRRFAITIKGKGAVDETSSDNSADGRIAAANQERTPVRRCRQARFLCPGNLLSAAWSGSRKGAGVVRCMAEGGLLDRSRKLAPIARQSDRIHHASFADGRLIIFHSLSSPVCRRASPRIRAAEIARLRERCPSTIGMHSRVSAAW